MMDDARPAEEALTRMRRGDLVGALAVLEQAEAEGVLDLEGQTLRFLLLRQTGDEPRAADVAARCLEHELSSLSRSTWLLRYGLVLSSLGQKSEAVRAFGEVLKLHASEDHERQARRALLDLAS